MLTCNHLHFVLHWYIHSLGLRNYLGPCKWRFSFTKHLISATLLQGDKFQDYKEYNSQFPKVELNTTIEAYPLLKKSKLKTELQQ